MTAPATLAPAELIRVTNIARRFFIEGRSKGEIAAEFGVSRFKVARILERARAEGVVRIEIRLPARLDASLAHKLRDAFRLQRARVVNCPMELEAQMRQPLAHAAATLLTEIVTADDVLGVGYGRTLTLVADEIDRLAPCLVVQLAGALFGVNNKDNSVELARQISARTGGPCHSIYAPQVLPDVQTAESVCQSPEVIEAYNHFGSITKALVAVGSWTPPQSQLHDSLPARQARLFTTQGVVAEIGAVLLDRNGAQIMTEFSDRCISISGPELHAIDEVIAVAGGEAKTDAVWAALAGGYVDSLVVDSSLAASLLVRAGSP